MVKSVLGKKSFFFAKLLVKQLSAFHHPYLPGTQFLFPVSSRYTSFFQTSLFENIDTILATWPFNRPYPRTRLFQNSFTLHRCTQSTRSRKSAGNDPRTVHNSMQTSDNWSGLSIMVKLVYDYLFDWVCSPRHRASQPSRSGFPWQHTAKTGDPTVAAGGKINSTLCMSLV